MRTRKAYPAKLALRVCYYKGFWRRLKAIIDRGDYVAFDAPELPMLSMPLITAFIEMRHGCTPRPYAAPMLQTCVNEGGAIHFAFNEMRIIYNPDNDTLCVMQDEGYCGEDR